MLAFVNISPVDKGESVSKYVAEIIKIIDQSGLKYKLTAMGTMIEGETSEVFDLIEKCHLKMKEMSNRVITLIYIDDRKGMNDRLEGKVKSIEEKLGKKLS